MKLTKEIEKDLKRFNWKYIDNIEGTVYHLKSAKDFKSPSIPHVISEDRICFWHGDCDEHACCIQLEDILIFSDYNEFADKQYD